ncbi:MAG: zf-HC2 domain-containing protein [Ktedonobacteraceae bacterium]|nr:zf-HC2 domain-containing protein [Ktedonobacteraceae bacterium]
MRCRNAREWLSARRDVQSSSPEAQTLRAHLKLCAPCRKFEQRQRKIETVFCKTVPKAPPFQSASVSTDTIMQAIQQQTEINQQFDDIRQQQRIRMARMRTVGAASMAIGFFTLSSIPLLFLAVTIIQTDLALKTLTLLNDFIDMLIIMGQYVQIGLILVTRDNWLLSAMAFVVVVMMGMWLRLMRPPQGA